MRGSGVSRALAGWLAGSCGNREDWIEMLTCREASEPADRGRGRWGVLFSELRALGFEKSKKVKTQQKCLDAAISALHARRFLPPPRRHRQKDSPFVSSNAAFKPPGAKNVRGIGGSLHSRHPSPSVSRLFNQLPVAELRL